MTRPVSVSLALALTLSLLLLAACAGGPPTTATPAATPYTLPENALSPRDLIGKTAAELEQALGVPGLKRTDPPAEIWQYTHTACTVNVFLYSDGKDAPHRVEHVEAFNKTGAAMDTARCLNGGGA